MSQYSSSKSNICTQTSHSLIPSPKPRYFEKFRQAKLFAEKAMKENRIFTIVGRYPYIRLALRKRGWVEKTYYGDIPAKMRRRRRKCVKSSGDPSGSISNGQTENKEKSEINVEYSGGDVTGSSCDDDSDNEGEDTTRTVACSPSQQQATCEIDEMSQDDDFWENEDINNIMSRMVRKASPNFIWTCRRDCIYFKRIRKHQLVNHFPSADFTTKVGLCNCLQDLRWWAEVDVRNYFPRCYCIGVDEEKYAFTEDFRLTACLGILKWVINFVQSTKITNFTLPLNCLHVPVRVAEVALQQCEAYLRCKNHEDIDSDVTIPMTDDQWSVVLDWYYQLVHKNALMLQVETIHEKCLKMLKRMRPHWPQMELDGMNNVWIVKPGAKSRGIGIMILERLDDILNLVDSQVVVKTTKYVVQKYIERPFLIYNTKFDIRQWFMVTDWNPLTIYFYKDCYMRFCSRYFSLTDKSEAVHLCNNAVQRRYMHEERPSVLPRYAMWSSDEFKDFLKKRGKSLVWDKIIYPGMKDAVTASMIAAQDLMDAKRGCFELYGADFMLTENFHPWLLEINSSPCLAPTTQVTARLCANVLEDAIKVLVDRRYDRNASIGEFELAFRQVPLTMPPYIGVNLMVQGTAIAKPQNRFFEASFEMTPAPKLVPRKRQSKVKPVIKTSPVRKTIRDQRKRPRSSSVTTSPHSREREPLHDAIMKDKSVVFVAPMHEATRSSRTSSRDSLHIQQLYGEYGIADSIPYKQSSSRTKGSGGRVSDDDDKIPLTDYFSSSSIQFFSMPSYYQLQAPREMSTERKRFKRFGGATPGPQQQQQQPQQQQQSSKSCRRKEFPTLSFITLNPWQSPSSTVVPSNWHPYTWYQLPSTLQAYLQDLDQKRANMMQIKESNSPYGIDDDSTSESIAAETNSGPCIVPLTY